MTHFKTAREILLYVLLMALGVFIMSQLASAQAVGSCWQIKSDLKKFKRYNCAAINDSPFQVAISQHRIFHQLRQVRPIPHSLVLERAADQNRNHGNSRLERVERHGVPLAGALGAFGVYGGGPITAGLSAAAPILVPAIRKWFSDASKPPWEEAPELLSNTEIVMPPGSATGFWFYAEKGKMDGEFKILPMEMAVVEESIQQRQEAPWFVPTNSNTPTPQYEVVSDTYPIERVAYQQPAYQQPVRQQPVRVVPQVYYQPAPTPAPPVQRSQPTYYMRTGR